MAAKIESTESVDRSDAFEVNPNDISFDVQSRIIPNATEADDVKARAVEFATVGQIQPVVARKDKDHRLTLVLGNTRVKAARLLREGFEAVDPTDGQTRQFHDPNFKIKVLVEKLTDDQAFDKAVLENQARRDTTPVQEALIQNKYRTERGWTDARIATFFGYTNQNRVMALKRLIALPQHVQDKVHSGDLSLNAALNLGQAPGEEQEAILAAATGENGKIDPAKIKAQVREVASEVTETRGTVTLTAANKKRSVRDWNQYVAEQENVTNIDPDLKRLLGVVQEWFAGERQDRSIDTALLDLTARLNASKVPAKAGGDEKKKDKATGDKPKAKKAGATA